MVFRTQTNNILWVEKSANIHPGTHKVMGFRPCILTLHTVDDALTQRVARANCLCELAPRGAVVESVDRIVLSSTFLLDSVVVVDVLRAELTMSGDPAARLTTNRFCAFGHFR